MRVLFTFTKMIDGKLNVQSFAYDGEDDHACYDAMLEDRGFMMDRGWFCQGQEIPQGNRRTLFGPWESFTDLLTKEEVERGQWLGDEPMSVHEKQCGNLYRWLEANDEGEWETEEDFIDALRHFVARNSNRGIGKYIETEEF